LTDRLSRNVGKKLPLLAVIQEGTLMWLEREGQTLCALSSHFICYVRMVLRSESSPFLQDGIASELTYVFLVLHQHGQVAIIRPESFPSRTGQVRCKSSGVCCSCRPGPHVLVHVSVRHTIPNYRLI